MTDRELEDYLGLTPEEGATILPRMTAERRTAYERMAAVETEIVLWQQGVGPFPDGVLIDTDRTIRHGSLKPPPPKSRRKKP